MVRSSCMPPGNVAAQRDTYLLGSGGLGCIDNSLVLTALS